MSGDYIKFGSLILNGEGAVGQTGAIYTVTRAGGLGGLPRPRVVVTQLVGVSGSLLSEADDDMRVVVLEGEVHAASHELLMEELRRFKYELSTQRGQLWLYWTPEEQPACKIGAVLQNDGAVALDAEDDTTAIFRLEFLCADPYWWSISSTTISRSVTATGQTLSVTNHGTAYSEPIIRITPTQVKASGYSYKRWLAVYNRVARALSNYPIEVTTQAGTGFNHQALVGAGHAQADGDDLRVTVDGVEVNRWLDGPNTATCKVWVNLTYQVGQSAILAETFGAGDSISSISVDDVSDFPSSGILYNPTSGEAFTYTARDDVLNRFSGVTRAAKGTTAATNTSGQTLWWVQHDVWLLYGNASATAPVTDDNVKPILELDLSTNTSWVYEVFGEDDGLRTASWVYWYYSGTPEQYTATMLGTANPWEVLGMEGRIGSTQHRLYLYNPCGITNADFTNGLAYSGNPTWSKQVSIQSGTDGSTWVDEYNLPNLSDHGVWEAWSRNEALTTGSLYAALFVWSLTNVDCLEAGDCTLTLNSAGTPGIVLGDEQGSYDLDATITMVEDGADGVAMRLQCTLDLNQTLEVDCGERTVTYLADNSNQFQAITLQSPFLRNYWFRLPGHWDGGKTVALRYDETGVAGVTLAVTYYDRDV
ncbi:MAG TPA: hypothetical protein VMY80_14025 [Anaerolineae bacterium]|nr:hypothetical protein [Anaerolineae bacterium]